MSYKEYTVRVYDSGDKIWFINGKYHREDGPAIECADGTKEWWINDQLHREDGPAVEYANGAKGWYINGKRLTKKQFNARNVVEMTIDDIEKLVGKKVKIVA